MDADLPEVLEGVRDGYGIGWLSREDAIDLIAGSADCDHAEAGRLLDAPEPQYGWTPRLMQGGAA
jgi:hypothetical protein